MRWRDDKLPISLPHFHSIGNTFEAMRKRNIFWTNKPCKTGASFIWLAITHPLEIKEISSVGKFWRTKKFLASISVLDYILAPPSCTSCIFKCVNPWICLLKHFHIVTKGPPDFLEFEIKYSAGLHIFSLISTRGPPGQLCLSWSKK